MEPPREKQNNKNILETVEEHFETPISSPSGKPDITTLRYEEEGYFI